MSVYIKGMEMPVDCLACRVACDKESYMVIGRPPKCPLAEAKTGDLISRECAINAVALEIASMFDVTTYDGHEIAEHALSSLPSAEGGDAEMNEVKSPYMQHSPDGADLISRADAIEAVTDIQDGSGQRYYLAVSLVDKIRSLPSADAVSMEEHVKELNDLAVEWKAKFAKAEKITDGIYDETMAKVAKECEECKERLRNIHPSAEAVHGYTEWLEKIIVMLEPEYLCEDTTDKEWCEENCHHSSIQSECLRHLYEVDNGGADAEAVQGDGRNNLKRYPNCQMRTSLGNCDAIGGFCTSINAPICDAFHKLSEAVQGEWIEKGGELVCSVCGNSVSFSRTPKGWVLGRFCQTCGAKMTKGGDNNEID